MTRYTSRLRRGAAVPGSAAGARAAGSAGRSAKRRVPLSKSALLNAAPVHHLRLDPHKAGQAVRLLKEIETISAARRRYALPREVAPATTFSLVPPPPREDPGRLRDEDAAAFSPADLPFTVRPHAGEKLNAGTRPSETARRMDAERASGRVRSPLHGIPWGAKDLFDTAGIATEYGAEPFVGRVPEEDADVVRALEEAGAVLVAKLSLGALAYGDIWNRGRTLNPWNQEHGASGSSAGSAAAVTAGLVPFALGTETMGSIISPSLACGAAGLRPTFGRVPRGGCMPLCWSYDKIGPIARSAECTAAVLAAVGSPDFIDSRRAIHQDPDWTPVPFQPCSRKTLDGVRIGVLSHWFTGKEAPHVAESDFGTRAVRRAVEELGGELKTINLPEIPWDILLIGVYAEAAASFERVTDSGADDTLRWQSDEAWPNVFRSMRFVPAIEYIESQRVRRAIMNEIDSLLSRVDLILAPARAEAMLLATNGSGHPSLTIRTGFRRDRMPSGVTLYGRYWEESTLVAIGSAIERHIGVWKERPDGFADGH